MRHSLLHLHCCTCIAASRKIAALALLHRGKLLRLHCCTCITASRKIAALALLRLHSARPSARWSARAMPCQLPGRLPGRLQKKMRPLALFAFHARAHFIRCKQVRPWWPGRKGKIDMKKQARIALCLEFAAEMRRHAATKSKASPAYYSAMRNARVFLLKAVALRAGANLKTLAIYKAERA